MADVAATIAGLDLLGARLDRAIEETVRDGLHLFQLAGMASAPVGVEGNSTNPPGDLARSIDVEGPRGGDGVYAGEVGPTTVYGRQRELGGDIYPGQIARSTGSMDHPLGTGGEVGEPLLVFTKFGQIVATDFVHQEGAHYMLAAYHETLPSLEPLAYSHAEDAIMGVQ